MYVAKVPNRTSPPAYLLRESYREGGKVKSRTLANITDWPMVQIQRLRRVLKGEPLVSPNAVIFPGLLIGLVSRSVYRKRKSSL